MFVPPSIDRLRARCSARQAIATALAVAALGAACTEGRLPTQGQGLVPMPIGVTLEAQLSSAGRAMKVVARYAKRSDTLQLVTFDSAKVVLTGTETQLPIKLDIATCLAASDRERPAGLSAEESAAVCVLRLTVSLLDEAGTLIDQSTLPPIAARPGEQTQAPPVSLGVLVGSVVLSADTLTINALTHTRTLSAVVRDRSGAVIVAPALAFTSLDPAVASVDSLSGRVTALSVGVARIVATSRDRGDTARVTVRQVPRTMSISAPATSLFVGDSLRLTTVVQDSAGVTIPSSAAALVSSDTSVARVSASGYLLGRRTGTVTVSGSAGPASAAQTFTVTEVPVASVSLSPSRDTISVGETARLTATVVGANGATLSGRRVVWSSSDTTKVRVDTAGFVTGVSVGTATITATSEGKSGTATVVVRGPSAAVYGVVRDLQTLAPLPSATLTLTSQSTGAVLTQTASSTGAFRFDGLAADTYTLTAVASGYQTNTAENLRTVSVTTGDVVRVDFSLPSTSVTQPIGAVAGRVLTSAGEPVAGASVSISGGTATNGVFKSTLTAADGTYTLDGITLTASSGELIASFSVIASKTGFQTTTQTGIVIAQNKTVTNVNFTLPAGSSTNTVFFADGFESTLGWTVSGFWNRTTGDGIRNTLFPVNVSLAPDDSSGAALPRAPEGANYLWYGQPSTGSFIGTRESGDTVKSGGTSVEPNSGTATSPAFTIGANAASVSLSFDTWFEIESVNPNSTGFDLMIVTVVDAATGTETELLRLNPFVDPELDDREHIPFTSGGFNRAPVFRPVTADLSAYRGKQVQLRLSFNTVDALFNGFRGWIVDNVRVSDQPASNASVASPSLLRAGEAAARPSGSGRCTTRCSTRRQ